MLDAEALEILYLEMLDEFFPGKRLGEGPVIELEGAVLGAENAFKLTTQSVLKEYLLRPKIDQQLDDIVEGSLGGEKLPVEISKNDTPQAPLPKCTAARKLFSL